MKNELLAQLQQTFGHTGFRPGQRVICEALLAGQDCLALMPTGSGKSLCYQLPGIIREGIVVVVSPLISLANDQAAKLAAIGQSVEVLNSSRTKEQLQRAMERIESGKIKFVLTTPERLQQTDLTETLAKVGVGLMAVDEAHCISQWGHDFRPDYLSLAAVRHRLNDPALIAMTATASPNVIDEIGHSLQLRASVIFRSDITRDNLRLQVRHCHGAEEKLEMLRQELSIKGSLPRTEPAIVYCSTTKTAEQLADAFNGLCYHGKMRKADRIEAQDRFMNGQPDIIFATNAFGLGIDKPDIRQVIHVELPGSLDAYYQEIGRSGRDGLPARCTLLYDRNDIAIQKAFAGGAMDASRIATAHRALCNAVEKIGHNRVRLQDILAVSPLGRTTQRMAMYLLASRRLVMPAGRGQWELLNPELSGDQAECLAGRTAAMAEDRQVALREMIEYVEASGCRWKRLRSHFGTGEDAPDGCRCDQCGNALVRAA